MSFTVALPTGEQIDVDAPDPQSAAKAARAYFERKHGASYANAFYAEAERQRKTNNAGLGGFTDQIFNNAGVGDELAGAGAATRAGVGNFVRTLRGQPTTTDPGEAYQGAADAALAQKRTFAQQSPVLDALATGAGIFGIGVPSGGGAVARPLLSAGTAGATWGAGAGAFNQPEGRQPRLEVPFTHLGIDLPNNRLGSGIEGAVKGAVLGPLVTGGVQAVPGAVAAGQALARNFTMTPQERALRMVGDALREGGALANNAKKGVPELQARANALQGQVGPVRETLAEIGGPSAQGLARAVANVPGPGQPIAQGYLADRRAGMTPRILGAAARAAGNPQDYGEAVVALRTTGKAASSAAYDAAMDAADQVVMPASQNLTADLRDHLYDVQNGPGIVPSDTSLTSTQRAVGAIQQLETLASSGRLSLRAVERVRQQLNRIAGSAKGDAYDGYATRSVIGFLDRRLDAIAAQNPEFAQALNGLKGARQGYGTMKSTDEAIEQGRRALKDDDTTQYLWMHNDGRGRTQAEADGYMVGVLRAVTEAVNSGDAAAVGRFARNKNIQASLAQALGQKQANQLMARVNREAAMQANNAAVTAGSRTTPMREEIDRWTSGQDELAFLSDLIAHPAPVKSVFLKMFASAYDRIRRPGLYNPRTHEAVANLLYQPANRNNAAALLQQIQNDPTALAAIRAAQQQAAIANQAQAIGGRAGQAGAMIR